MEADEPSDVPDQFQPGVRGLLLQAEQRRAALSVRFHDLGNDCRLLAPVLLEHQTVAAAGSGTAGTAARYNSTNLVAISSKPRSSGCEVPRVSVSRNAVAQGLAWHNLFVTSPLDSLRTGVPFMKLFRRGIAVASHSARALPPQPTRSPSPPRSSNRSSPATLYQRNPRTRPRSSRPPTRSSPRSM